jgi:PAS domain S-box-containing protein
MEAGVVVQDAAGRIVECNAHAERLLGLSYEQMAGTRSVDPVWRCVDADGQPWAGVDHPAMVVLRTGEPVQGAVMGVSRPDRTEVWIRITARPYPVDGAVGVVSTFIDVTTERTTEATATANAARLAALTEAADGFAIRYELLADGSYVHADVNLEFVGRLIGTSLQAAPDPAAIWDSRIHPADRDRHLAHRRRLYHGEAADIEYRLIGFDGVERWVWSRDRPQRDGTGRLLISGVVFDVTARHRERIELDDARDRLHTVLETINEVVFEIEMRADGASRVTYGADGLERLLGRPLAPDENAIAALRMLVLSADRDRYLEHVGEIIAGQPSSIECRLAHADAAPRWVWIRARPRAEADGVTRLAMIVSDIDEIRRADERIAGLEGRLEGIVSAVDDVLYEVEVDGADVERSLYRTGSLRPLLGDGESPSEEGDEQLWSQRIHPDDTAARAAHIARSHRGEPSDVEYRVIGLDGVTRWIWVRRRPRRTADGRLVVYGIISDITARRSLVTERDRTERLLREVLETVDDFIAIDEILPDGRLMPVFVPSSIDRFHGTSVPPERSPERWARAIHPDDRERVLTAFADHRSTPQISIEYRMIRHDGAVRLMWDRSRAFEAPDGIWYAATVMVDVTEYRRHRDQGTYLERLAATVEEVLYIDRYDDDGARTGIYESPAGDRLLGGPAADVDTLSRWISAIHPDDLAAVTGAWSTLRAGRAADVAYRLLLPDGRTVHIADRANPFRDGAGVLHVAGVARDVSERHALLERLADTEAHLGAIVGAIDDVLYIDELQPDGTFQAVYAAPGVHRFLGGEGEGPIQAEEWLARVVPEDRPLLEASVRAAATTETAVSVTYRMTGLDGRVRWIWDRGRSTRAADGKLFLAGILSDVTAQRATVDRLTDAAAHVYAISEAVDDVFYATEILVGGESAPRYTGAGAERLWGGEPPQTDLIEAWFAAVHADDRAGYESALAALQETGEMSVEYRRRRLDGTEIRIWDRARSRQLEDGRTIVEGAVTDVTDRIDDGARPADLIRYGLDLLTIDRLLPDGTVEQVYVPADGPARMYGPGAIAPLDPIAAFFDAIHPDDRMRARSIAVRVAGGGVASEEYRVIGQDGVTRWFWDRTHGVPQPDGSTLLYGALVDVTEATTSRISLTHAEATLRELTDAVPDFLFTAQLLEDGELQAVAVTPGLGSILGGHVPATAQGQLDLLLSRTHPDDLDVLAALLDDLREGRGPTRFLRLHGLDSSVRDVRISARSRALDSGSILVHGIVSDLTGLGPLRSTIEVG